MAFSLVRVDDRLIHGQVVAVWTRSLQVTRIIIVDDVTAADEFLAEILVFAAPPGVEVEVLTEASAVTRLGEVATSAEKTIVLMKTPLVAKRLVDQGVAITELNIGGIAAGSGRSPLYKNISASQDERQAMKDLVAQGVAVNIRIVYEDKPIPFESISQSSG